MGFGIKVDVKAVVPKVELPKVDVAAAVTGAANAAAGAVAGAVASATAAVNGAVASATAAVESAVSSLSSVAGAIAEVAVSFTGAISDIVLEPHLQLDANASWGDTKFEKGPIWIRIELTTAEANTHTDTLHLFSGTGSYDQQKKISSYTESAESTVDILFEDAPMNETFSLEVIPEQGAPHTMFSDVTYGNLRKTKQRFQE